MSGSTGSSLNGTRAAAVRRLQVAVAERRQARERREAGKAVVVETDASRRRMAEITVQRKDA